MITPYSLMWNMVEVDFTFTFTDLRRNCLTYSDEIWYGYTCGSVACFRGQPRPHPKGMPYSGVGVRLKVGDKY